MYGPRVIGIRTFDRKRARTRRPSRFARERWRGAASFDSYRRTRAVRGHVRERISDTRSAWLRPSRVGGSSRESGERERERESEREREMRRDRRPGRRLRQVVEASGAAQSGRDEKAANAIARARRRGRLGPVGRRLADARMGKRGGAERGEARRGGAREYTNWRSSRSLPCCAAAPARPNPIRSSNRRWRLRRTRRDEAAPRAATSGTARNRGRPAVRRRRSTSSSTRAAGWNRRCRAAATAIDF